MDQTTKTWVFDDLDDLDDPDYEFEHDHAVEVRPPSLSRLASCGTAERTRLIDDYVRAELARVLRIPPDTIDTAGRPMNSLGIGSITGLELQRRMEAVLKVDVNLNMLLRANSAAELVDCLAGQLGPEDNPHKHGGQRDHLVSHDLPSTT
ncbi:MULTISPECIES: acyl carrier protein [unclassified Streptomyces]|uniref:acyl carrier protein n=1 Tax=unclassified Streptomyces TaxID=2593676 RepID=UPI001F04B60F|nr:MULTISPECIES: acyl carrier protein [unclassified Streptomyces]MCH0564266.1 acyl carrier protein [Streptomyces sp. MUM 2J]MCH0569437.1 acyl carrier protein [Streptomyces sp. MUM 136J]